MRYFGPLFLLLSLFLVPAQAQESSSPLVRGLQYYNEQKYDQALNEFSQILEKNPTNIDALYYKGLTLDKAKKPELAIASFEKVLEFQPNYSGARLQLGISYFKLKSNALAINELSEVLEEDSQNATAHLFMGFVLQQMEKYEDSLIFFQTALSLDPSLSQMGYFQIGVAHFEMGNKEDAKIALQLALDEDPKTDTAKQAHTLLKQMGVLASSEKKWWIEAGATWLFDDNVTLIEQDIVSGEEDMSAGYVFSLGKRFEISKNSQFEMGYDFSQTLADKLPQFDIQSHDFNLAPSFESGNWDGDVTYNFSYSFLDRKDFTAVHSITPRLAYSANPRFYTSLGYSFKINDYLVGNDRDGTNHLWSLTQFWFFMDQKAFLIFIYSFDKEDTEDFELDYLGHSASAGFSIPGPFKITTRFNYNYYLKKYQNDTSSIGEQRFDAKHTLSLFFKRPIIGKYLDFDIGYTRVMSNSNLESIDFNQNAYSISLNLKF